MNYFKLTGQKPVPLVVFCGARGAGKDTAANALSWKQSAFATAPKKAAGTIYGLGGFFLDDAVKDVPIAEAIEPLGLMIPQEWVDKRMTSRDVVREYAEKVKEEMGNRAFWAICWLNTYYAKACREGRPLVLKDMRFPEEIELVRSLNPTVIHITGRGVRDDHVSDNPVPIIDGDYVIENTRTVKSLHDKVRNIVIRTYGAIQL